MEHYSGGIPHCACCMESNVKFLTIDHIKNNGSEHRRQIKASGASFYRWIIKNKFPEDLQVLCMNCNAAKYWYGTCPHKECA